MIVVVTQLSIPYVKSLGWHDENPETKRETYYNGNRLVRDRIVTFYWLVHHCLKQNLGHLGYQTIG